MNQTLSISILRKGDLINDLSNIESDDFISDLYEGRLPSQTLLEENKGKYLLKVNTLNSFG